MARAVIDSELDQCTVHDSLESLLRIQLELFGPEYAVEFSSLNTGLKIFMSREVNGDQGGGSGGKTERRAGFDARLG